MEQQNITIEHAIDLELLTLLKADLLNFKNQKEENDQQNLQAA